MKKFNELREQYLEEKLKASDPAGTYIHDFVHSDNPKFAGKSKAKRIQMALAASYAAKGKSRNEETEQIDELKKSTLGSYVKKATNGMSGIAINAHQAGGASPGSKERKTFLAKANKRIAGVDKAINRLSK